MKISNQIPCPITTKIAIETEIQSVLSSSLKPMKSARTGDLVAISQSILVDNAKADRHASFGYWVLHENGSINPTPFRCLPTEIHAQAGQGTAQVLDNIYTRNTICPAVLEMITPSERKGSHWFEALYVPGGVLLFRADAIDMREITDAAERGKLHTHIRFLAMPETSQHACFAARTELKKILTGLTGRFLNRSVEEDDPVLVPGLG